MDYPGNTSERLRVLDQHVISTRLSLQRLIGRGGFSQVYAADLGGQKLAVKILHPRAQSYQQNFERLFIQEAEISNELKHENIVRCLGLTRIPPNFPGLHGLQKETWAMLLELCEGGTLQDVILQAMSNQRQYTTEMALSWLHDVAEALTALHTHGSEVIIHRDVKSDNVLLTGSSSSTTTASARNSAKGHGAGGGLGGGSSKKLVGGLRGGAVSGSCSGWAAARTTAKLADLGLHVRIEDERPVMLRCRAAASLALPPASWDGLAPITPFVSIHPSTAPGSMPGPGAFACATDASDTKLSSSNNTTCRNMLLTTDLPSGGSANAAAAATTASATWHGSAHVGKASGSLQSSKLLLHPWTESGDGAAATPSQDVPNPPAGNNESPSVQSKGSLSAMPSACGSDLGAAAPAGTVSVGAVRSTSSSSDAALHVTDVAHEHDTAVSSGAAPYRPGQAPGSDVPLAPSPFGGGAGRRLDAQGVLLPPCPPGMMLECPTRNSFLSAIAELDGKEGDDANSEAVQTEGSLLGTLSLRPSTTSNTNSTTPCSQTPVHQQQQHQQQSSHASTPSVLGRSSSGGGSRVGGLLRSSSSSGAGRVGGTMTGGIGGGAGFPPALFRCSSSGANRGGYEPSRAYLHAHLHPYPRQSWQHLDSPTVTQLQTPFSIELRLQAQPVQPPGSGEQDPAVAYADTSFGPCLQSTRAEPAFEINSLADADACAPALEAAPCTFDFWAHGAAQPVATGPSDDAVEPPSAQSPSKPRCAASETASSSAAALAAADLEIRADAMVLISAPHTAPPGAAEPISAPLPPRTGSGSDKSVSSSSGTGAPTRQSREASQHYFNASQQQQQQQLALGHSLWSASASGSDSRASDTALHSPGSLQRRSSTTCTSFVSTDAGMSVTAAMTSFCSGASVSGGGAAGVNTAGAKVNLPLRCVSALDSCKEVAPAEGPGEEGDADEGTTAGGFKLAGVKGRRAGVGMILGSGGAAGEGKVNGREAQRQLPAMPGEGGVPELAAAGKADAARSQGGGELRHGAPKPSGSSRLPWTFPPGQLQRQLHERNLMLQHQSHMQQHLDRVRGGCPAGGGSSHPPSAATAGGAVILGVSAPWPPAQQRSSGTSSEQTAGCGGGKHRRGRSVDMPSYWGHQPRRSGSLDVPTCDDQPRRGNSLDVFGGSRLGSGVDASATGRKLRKSSSHGSSFWQATTATCGGNPPIGKPEALVQGPLPSPTIPSPSGNTAAAAAGAAAQRNTPASSGRQSTRSIVVMCEDSLVTLFGSNPTSPRIATGSPLAPSLPRPGFGLGPGLNRIHTTGHISAAAAEEAIAAATAQFGPLGMPPALAAAASGSTAPSRIYNNPMSFYRTRSTGRRPKGPWQPVQLPLAPLPPAPLLRPLTSSLPLTRAWSLNRSGCPSAEPTEHGQGHLMPCTPPSPTAAAAPLHRVLLNASRLASSSVAARDITSPTAAACAPGSTPGSDSTAPAEPGVMALVSLPSGGTAALAAVAGSSQAPHAQLQSCGSMNSQAARALHITGAHAATSSSPAAGGGGDAGGSPVVVLEQPAMVVEAESFAPLMRRVRSMTQLLDLPPDTCQLPEHDDFDWVYGLTGQAGSCMYMAPEVFLREPYNEKCDVFSFGVLAFELLSRQLLLTTYVNTDLGTQMGVRTPRDFAKKVSEGFRPPRAACLTDEQWQLVCCCWDADPCARPPMAVVTGQLAAMLSDVRKERERSSKAQQELIRWPTLRRQGPKLGTPAAGAAIGVAADAAEPQPQCGCVIA